VVYTVSEADGRPLAKPKVFTSWYADGVRLVKLKCDGGEKSLNEFTPWQGEEGQVTLSPVMWRPPGNRSSEGAWLHGSCIPHDRPC